MALNYFFVLKVNVLSPQSVLSFILQGFSCKSPMNAQQKKGAEVFNLNIDNFIEIIVNDTDPYILVKLSHLVKS